MQFSAGTLTLALAAFMVAAHLEISALERRDFLANSERTSLSHCGEQLAKRSMERRKTLMQKRSASVVKRHPSDINKSHLSTEKFGPDTPTKDVFAKNAQCLLSPETTEGPYYVLGERVRQNITEKEPGVKLILDLDVLDVSTCEPVPHVWVEVWHTNATGVYSGVPSGAAYSQPTANIDSSFLRGLQRTDAEGAVQFETIYPGHYAGRTQHIHVMVHQTAAEPLPNNQSMYSLLGSHASQMYFDQDLSSAIEKLQPYASNTQPVVRNAEDRFLSISAAGEDPLMSYSLLGDSPKDGIFGWYSFGINTTFNRRVQAAAMLTEGGGVRGPFGPPPTVFKVRRVQRPLVD